MTTSVSETI